MKISTLPNVEEARVEIEVLPKEWKCLRCYQYKIECSKDNYHLCYRCQDYMHKEKNNICVACGNDEAMDNLCDNCRASRIIEYDKKFLEKLMSEKTNAAGEIVNATNS